MWKAASLLFLTLLGSVGLAAYLYTFSESSLLYRGNISCVTFYEEILVPFEVKFPCNKVEVSLDVDFSLALWSIRIEHNNVTLWRYDSGGMNVTSGWVSIPRGESLVVMEVRGVFNATLTIEATLSL